MAYKRPILQEIFAEILIGDGVLVESKFLDLANSLREVGFSTPEFQQADSIKIIQGQPAQAVTMTRLRMWNPERTKLIQFSIEGFYFNQLGPYLGWDVFDRLRQTVEDTIGSIMEVPLNIREVALICIDKLVVPSDGFRFGKYLDCSGKYIPIWYSEASQDLDISLGLGLVDSDGRNTSLNVAVRRQAAEVSIQLVTTFRAAYNSRSNSSLKSLLDILHVQSLELFESIITDETRTSVMGGQR